MNTQPEESKLPLAKQVPAASLASPSELRPRDARDVRWYKPGFGEVVGLMGWRVLYFLPATLLVMALPLAFFRWWALQFVWVGWKLVVILIALPTGAAIKATRNILRNRKEPFCIHCGYDLTGLPDNHVCPECGEGYSFRVIEEYKRDPHWFIQRYRMHDDIPSKDVPFEAGKVLRRRSRDGT
jgi:predicted RNA-binding Zn-ribbon protein involved in translation (DUF1610 family)